MTEPDLARKLLAELRQMTNATPAQALAEFRRLVAEKDEGKGFPLGAAADEASNCSLKPAAGLTGAIAYNGRSTEPRMRLASSPQSFNEGSPAWLAILEFFIAGGIAIWIVIDGRFVGDPAVATCTATLPAPHRAISTQGPNSFGNGLVFLST